MVNPNSDFHIFRDCRRLVYAADLLARLRNGLQRVSSSAAASDLLNVLLLAGELECGLEDAAHPDAHTAAELTSYVADLAIAFDACPATCSSRLLAKCASMLDRIRYSGTVGVSAAEGFAYYALHPLDYADLIARLRLRTRGAFVIGIRSVGTTLSAVVCAKLRQIGTDARRITVRPVGHPYRRECKFDQRQHRAVANARSAGAQFIVCDEGPGRSGSSLLSVAEALEREGVAPERILILCSHEPDVSALRAPDAARRWKRYRSSAAAMTRRLPKGADVYAGGGEWRRHLLAAPEEWPAVWPQMERLKYLSADGRQLLTFAGHGPYGAANGERNATLAASGFGPPHLGHDGGFSRHLVPPGRLLRRSHVSPDLLTHMAEYCAWRARKFAVDQPHADDLAIMLRTNFTLEFRWELPTIELPVVYPTVCDNRMAPQYWLLTEQGRVLKLDAAIHGDDHFFPGPCDIAWDLAGVAVEWELSSASREFLLARYRQTSGDDCASRLPHYELAYSMFRLAWSRMAAASVAGSEEEAMLLRDAQRYRQEVRRITACRTPQSPRPPAAARFPQAQETSAAPELL